MMRDHRIRTVIVDDSAVARQLLSSVLSRAGDFEIVETVADGELAVERVATVRPDLVTMDIHLPGIDGLEATRRIMRRTPTPIAVVAASANLNDATIFQALEAGALTAVQRPIAPGQPDYLGRRRRLLAELRAIARATFNPRSAPAAVPPRRPTIATPVTGEPRGSTEMAVSRGRLIEVIGIATSTGGPQALKALLSGLPAADLPPVLVVQHIAEGFAHGLAEWLGAVMAAPVRVATDGERLAKGTVLVAPDRRHLTVTPDGGVRLLASAAVGGHRPSATVLFESIASTYGPRAMGIVLTGMGRDGADGLLSLRRAGGRTVAEDPATAVVGAMPGAAIELGAIDHVLSLPAIAPALSRLLAPRGAHPRSSRPSRGSAR